MKKYFLLINPAAGTARQKGELQKLLEAANQYPDLQTHLIQPNDNVRQLVEQARQAGITMFGVAGGDGTINAVASALVDTKNPLVVIPFGTFNHFARDMAVPSDFLSALDLFETGVDVAIDVGEVNGCYFLNNSSVGLYPSLVKERTKHEKNLGKGMAYLVAAWKIMRHPWRLHVKLEVDKQIQDIKAGIIFFANNRINLTPLEVGRRSQLDKQILDAFIVKASSIWQLLGITVSFLRDKLDQSPLVTRTTVSEAIIYTRRRHLSVACDGEVRRLKPPLKYRIRSAALIVRVLSPDNSVK